MQKGYEQLINIEAAILTAEREGFTHTASALLRLKEREIIEIAGHIVNADQTKLGASK